MAAAAADESIITINVGGKEIIQLKPELFSVLGDNKFASMCSERWQNQLDAEGRMFVDYSPQVFVPLIEFLRLARDSEPGMPAPVLVDPPYRRAWIRMMLASSFHPQVLRKAGMTPQELRDCGCDPKCLCEAGFTIQELGVQPTCPHGVQAPLRPQEEGLQLSLQDLMEAGYSIRELGDAGYSAGQLKNAGFTPQDFLEGGFTFRLL